MSTHLRHATTFVVVLALSVAVGACGSDGGNPFVPPLPDTTPPSVSATPMGGYAASYPSGVTLTATDARDANPVIYYTMDGTAPTDQSTLYSGPIAVSSDTVLRFFAVDASANASDPVTEGYVVTGGPGIKEDWAKSGHGDIGAEPWRHWDDDGVVSTSCAKCHSPVGFVDYAEDGTVDLDASLPLGLSCDGCHDGIPNTLWDDLATYPAMDPILFPSGESVSLFGPSNQCMACHQGRASSVDVDDEISQNPGGPHSFINIHYFAAAASYFGSEVAGGYEYAGMAYFPRNTFPSHPQELETCVGCHMRGSNKSHTFLPEVADCSGCHGGASFETLGGTPGLNHTRITSLKSDLLSAIQAYATGTIGTAICYSPDAYPYFFIDTNGNGTCEPSEGVNANKYTAFDDALLEAAYNYQVAEKEPCGYIHNGTYVQQFLYDSTMDLGGTPSVIPPGRTGFDATGLTIQQAATAQFKMSGHARADQPPYRHWDDTGEVETDCVRCHTSSGFADYADNMTIDDGPVRAIEVVGCRGCHESTDLFASQATKWETQDTAGSGPLVDVEFPSGVTKDLGDASNLCMSCHQGRGSGDDVATASANTVVQAPDYDSYDFVNRHYLAAAAIFFGTDVTAGYEYAGLTYRGQTPFTSHPADAKTCIGCHMGARTDGPHTWTVNTTASGLSCSTCHGVTDPDDFRNPGDAVDYDGDSSVEGYTKEIAGMEAILLAQIQAYAKNRLNGGANASPIVYSASAYPYFFMDTNADDVPDPGELTFANRYRDFDDLLLEAAYNYHSALDPCSGIHNGKYVMQTIYDSIDSMDDGIINDSPNASFGITRP